jgi:hypothetical protein
VPAATLPTWRNRPRRSFGRYSKGGHVPPDATALILSPGEGDDPTPMVGWALYRRPDKDDEWVNCKLIRWAPGKGSANYWISWSAKQKRFSRSTEFARLHDKNPDLAAYLEAFMESTFPLLKDEDMKLPDHQLST